MLRFSVSYVRYLSKILTYRGHLAAVPGKGFRLGKSPAEISLYSIFNVTQRRPNNSNNIVATEIESDLGRLLKKINSYEQYRNYTLLDLHMELTSHEININL